MLRGWFGYFKHAHIHAFMALDGFTRRRLRALLRKQEKRPGLGRCLADQMRWTNAFFAEAGLFGPAALWLLLALDGRDKHGHDGVVRGESA